MNTPIPAGLAAIVEITRIVYEAAGVPLEPAPQEKPQEREHRLRRRIARMAER